MFIIWLVYRVYCSRYFYFFSFVIVKDSESLSCKKSGFFKTVSCHYDHCFPLPYPCQKKEIKNQFKKIFTLSDWQNEYIYLIFNYIGNVEGEKLPRYIFTVIQRIVNQRNFSSDFRSFLTSLILCLSIHLAFS